MIVGILALNKDAGMTSFGAVREVRQIFGERRVGHAGTLDPTATGLLPICIGQATRLVDYFHAQPKAYRCTIRFGQMSDTLDTEGQISEGQDASQLTADAVVSKFPEFIGDIQQIPPMHSAVRHQGQHLYELARSGEEVEREPRPVTIHQIELNDFRPGPHAEADITVSCGKGVYMRVLAADLGERLGTGALLAWLERTSYGPLNLSSAVTLAQLREMDDPTKALLPASVAIEFLPRVDLAPQMATKMQRGQSVWVPNAQQLEGKATCRAHAPNGDLVAICEATGNLLKPTRVFSAR